MVTFTLNLIVSQQDQLLLLGLNHSLFSIFLQLLTTQAVHRWGQEIHEGIYDMLHLLLNLVASRLKYKPVPFGLLELLTQVHVHVTQFEVHLALQ